MGYPRVPGHPGYPPALFQGSDKGDFYVPHRGDETENRLNFVGLVLRFANTVTYFHKLKPLKCSLSTKS